MAEKETGLEEAVCTSRGKTGDETRGAQFETGAGETIKETLFRIGQEETDGETLFEFISSDAVKVSSFEKFVCC